MKKRPFTKRGKLSRAGRQRLERAAAALENAAGNVYAALWYLERGAFKGHSWGHSAIADVEYALADLRALFPASKESE